MVYFVQTLRHLSVIASMCLWLSCAHAQGAQAEACDGDLSDAALQVACHDAAFRSLDADPDAARVTLKRLCQQFALARACSNLAFSYEKAALQKPSYFAAAIDFYMRGCELNDGVACNNLANLRIQGRGAEVDASEGVRLLQKSCALDYAPGCYRTALITMRGTLAPPDPQTAAQLMRKGCDLHDAASCHDLGYLYMDGNGVPRDQKKAVEVISASCEMGLPRGCGTLGSFYFMGGTESLDYAKALDLLQRACAGDDAPSCANLGAMIETGKGTAADPARAAQYDAKACSAGDTLGCGNLGVLQAEGRGVDRDDRSALENLARGCAGHVPEACRVVALFHAQGRAGLPRSKATATFYRRRACEAGDEPSCAVLSVGFKSLCGKGETRVMACMTGRRRMVSLCSVPNTASPATLVYRFGSAGRVELEHSGPVDFSTSSGAGGEQATLSFDEGAVRYRVSESTSKWQDPPLRKVQVEVAQSGKTTTLDCRYPILGTLNADGVRKAGNLGAAR